jgi:hypothetical protein
MNETRILIRLLRMYIPRNWEFGWALAKLRNFGEKGVWPPPPSLRHCLFSENAVEHGAGAGDCSPVERVSVPLIVHRDEVHHQHVVRQRVQTVQPRLESREHPSAKNGMSYEIRASHRGTRKRGAIWQGIWEMDGGVVELVFLSVVKPTWCTFYSID